MKKIIIITGNELRHNFIRLAISHDPNIHVLRSYCETIDLKSKYPETDRRHLHLKLREDIEKDFFQQSINYFKDKSNPIKIPQGNINKSYIIAEIKELNPNLLVVYGSSLIKEELISLFPHKILNVHLGLSPYYRGAASNYWAFHNRELELIGATFMYLNKGIDTGNIIHQIRPEIYHHDTIHTIGNRLISMIPGYYRQIINNYQELGKGIVCKKSKTDKYYKMSDFTDSSLKFVDSNSIILNYFMLNRTKLLHKYPIVENKVIR